MRTPIVFDVSLDALVVHFVPRLLRGGMEVLAENF
jgi:hypothetical protein